MITTKLKLFWQAQDKWLLGSAAMLLVLGLIMVASASADFAAHRYGDVYYFTKRHAVYLLIGLVGLVITASIPLNYWFKWSTPIFLIAFMLLILVLFIGTDVNGSRRWIRLAGFSIQPSELMKVAVVLAAARYLTRFRSELTSRPLFFIRPLLVVGVVVVLLLKEPDFGASALISATVVGMLFLAGAPLIPFASMAAITLTAAYYIAISTPYRLARLTGFADPWANQWDSGYQLTQSLIAFGRGHFDGVGYGNSVQKLMFLPEAHTDFVFSIWAEETGWIGALLIVALFSIIVSRLLVLCKRSLKRNQPYVAWIAAGFTFLIAGQAFINLGVASGLLPTKGLTLPFVSYGGSSLLVSMAMIGIVMRLSVSVNHLTTKSRGGRVEDPIIGVIPT